MAEIATIARPYAEAVFALADKGGALVQWSETLGRLAAVAQAPEMAGLFGNPKVTSAQFVDLFSGVAGAMPAEATSFLQMQVAARRRRRGAVPLEGADLSALVADLERRFKRKIRPQVTVVKELIGGAKVSVGDQVIDGTVRGKLEAMNAGLMGS